MLFRTISTVVICFLCIGMGNAQDFSREAIQKGKDATAFLIVGKHSSTAFCFNSEGYFATSFQAVKGLGVGRKVRLVLYPGEAREKELEGELLHAVDADDVAIIKVDEKFEFPVLELASSGDLKESDKLIAFAYPFGNELSLFKGNYPTVSVTAGEITSVRKESGVTELFHTGIRAVPGCQGGPLLNTAGKVIGIQQFGKEPDKDIIGVPVEKMSKLVQEPRIEFLPQPIGSVDDLVTARKYYARVNWVVPLGGPFEMKLMIEGQDQPAQVIPMILENDSYSAEAVLKPGTENGGLLLPVQMVFGKDKLEGKAVDCQLQIDSEEFWLHELRSLRFESASESMRGMTRKGKLFGGKISGLESIPIRLGQQTVKIHPENISSANFPDLDYVFTLTASLYQDDEILSSSSYQLDCAGRVKAGNTLSSSVTRKPALVHGEEKPKKRPVEIMVTESVPGRPPRTVITRIENGQLNGVVQASGGELRVGSTKASQNTINLPCQIKQVSLGGNGRYLVLHLADQRRLAIVDLLKSQIVNYIPLSAERILVATGGSKLIVALCESRILERWDLDTAQREESQPIEVEGEIFSLAMGAASEGPILLNTLQEKSTRLTRCNFYNIDLESLKASPHQLCNRYFNSYSQGLSLTASGDSQSFGLVVEGSGSGRYAILSTRGEKERLVGAIGQLNYLALDGEGQRIATARGLYDEKFKSVDPENSQLTFAIPSQPSGLFLRGGHIPSGLNTRGAVSPTIQIVHQNDQSLQLASYSKALLVRMDRSKVQTDVSKLPPNERLFLSLSAGKLVVIPISGDQVVLHTFQLDAALEAMRKDYLLVTAVPPSYLEAGSQLKHDLRVRSKSGGVTYKLLAAPSGMTIDPAGVLHWPVPAEAPEEPVSVSIQVDDASGLKTVHTFALTVVQQQ